MELEIRETIPRTRELPASSQSICGEGTKSIDYKGLPTATCRSTLLGTTSEQSDGEDCLD